MTYRLTTDSAHAFPVTYSLWDVAKSCQMSLENVQRFSPDAGVTTHGWLTQAQYDTLVSTFGTDPRFVPYTKDLFFDSVPFGMVGNMGM